MPKQPQRKTKRIVTSKHMIKKLSNRLFARPSIPPFIPEELIRANAYKIWKERQRKGENGSPEADWSKAVEFLNKHWWYVALWKTEKHYVEPFADLLERADVFRIFEKLGFAIAVVSTIVGVTFYVMEAGERREKSILEAWDVVKDGKDQKSGVVKLALERLKKEGFILSGIDLKGSHLSNIDLGCNYPVQNFGKPICTNLSFANLSEVNLILANLKGVNLSNTCLNGAYLLETNLEDANLTDADLSNADLNSARLWKANLRNANLSGANLNDASDLTLEQVKQAKNWDKANYSSEFRKLHNLPSIKFSPKKSLVCDNQDISKSNNSKYNLAINAYTQVINRNPNDAWAYIKRGYTYTEKKDYDLAINDFNKAIKLDPNIAWAYINRGHSYNEKKEYDLAINDSNKAIELDPNIALAYINRGVSYDSKKEYDRAINDYNQAIELDPNDAEPYNSRGYAYMNKGEYDRAINDLNKAIKLDPNHADAYDSRCEVYNKKGNYDRAIADCNQAVNLNLEVDYVYYNRGIAYKNKGSKDKAIENFKKVLELNNDKEYRQKAEKELQELGTK